MGGNQQIIHLNHHHGLELSDLISLLPQTGLKARLLKTKLGKMARKCLMPEQRGIVKSVDRGHKLDKLGRTQAQTFAGLHIDGSVPRRQLVALAKSILRVRNSEFPLQRSRGMEKGQNGLRLGRWSVTLKLTSVRVLVTPGHTNCSWGWERW